MQTVARTVALTKTYGRITAVDHLNIEVPARSVFGLLGPNGAGKTTTIRMLLGLVRSSDGWIELLGHVHGDHDYKDALRRVGALIEGPALYPALSGRRNLDIHSRYLKLENPRARADQVLDAVGLRDRAGDKVRKYSQGMRQRLGIAIALLGKPEVLILDEPTNGLDAAGIVEMRTMMKRLPEFGASVILSSHLLSEVEMTCDHVAIMNGGRLVVGGETSEIMYRYGRTNRIRVVVVSDDHARAGVALSGAGYRFASPRYGTFDVEVPPGVTGRYLTWTLAQAGVYADEVSATRMSLEDVFLNLTGEQYSAADDLGGAPVDELRADELRPENAQQAIPPEADDVAR